jgi:hypothetical protein
VCRTATSPDAPLLTLVNAGCDSGSCADSACTPPLTSPSS